MKRFWAVALALSLVLAFTSTSVSAKSWKSKKCKIRKERVNPWTRLYRSGDIKGNLKCHNDAPVQGVLVLVPGTSLMAMTDNLGEFRIYNVPQGVHDLAVGVPGQAPVILATDVQVRRRTVTVLNDLPVDCKEDKEVDGQPPVRPDPTLVIVEQVGETDWSTGIPLTTFDVSVTAEPASIMHLYASSDCTQTGADFEQSSLVPDSGTVVFQFTVPEGTYDWISLNAENDAGLSDCSGPISLTP